MSREIRISIDDDEVFERMKRRKAALDLSWEEVLHRGLREFPREERRGPEQPWAPGSGPETPHDFAEELKGHVRSQVMNSLRSSLGGFEEWDDAGGLDREMGALTDAEDAVLAFDFLDDRPDYQVPLRVNLQTSREGLDVEVVTVRQGKSVRHTNRFTEESRRHITRELAGGRSATLEFADGVESYRVYPVLSWSRDEGGSPTVADVEITEVDLDDDA